MKAYKLELKKIPKAKLSGATEDFDYAEMMDLVILNSPPGQGLSSTQLLKTAALYMSFNLAKEKVKTPNWTWWIDKDQHGVLLSQLEGMRWAGSIGSIRLAIAEFVESIQKAVEEEVPNT